MRFGKIWVIIDTEDRNLTLHDANNQLIYSEKKEGIDMLVEKYNKEGFDRYA